MGITCGKVKLNTRDELLISKSDLKFKYKKFNDKCNHEEIFQLKEPIFKVFKIYSLNDYIQFLFTIKPDLLSKNSCSYYDLINISRILSIIKNKFLKGPLMSDSRNSENITEEFESNFTHFLFKYFNILKKNKQNIDKKLDGVKEQLNFLSILSLFPIGFLYCYSDVETKIKVMFNIISANNQSDSNYELRTDADISKSNNDYMAPNLYAKKNSKELIRFLYFMLIYPTNILYVTINELRTEDEKIEKNLSIIDVNSIYQIYESKDAYGIIDSIMNKIFESSEFVNYNTFYNNICKNHLYWIFDPIAVRAEFERHHNASNS